MKTVFVEQQKHGALISEEMIKTITTAIVDNFNPYSIILFGSYAYNNPTPDSDLDILIVMDTDLPSYRRAVPIRRLFNPMPCAMDIKVYTPDEVEKWNGTVNHIITEAFENGRILYERI